MTGASPPGLCWVVRRRPLLASYRVAAAGSGVGGRDRKGLAWMGQVWTAGVWTGLAGPCSLSLAGVVLKACDLWGLLRCGLHWVSSPNTLRFGGVFSS